MSLLFNIYTRLILYIRTLLLARWLGASTDNLCFMYVNYELCLVGLLSQKFLLSA